ncbi:hypothetical protein [Paenibacillus sp. OV219]|uniref:hypothetical protein n=1 Tax=Paenibacillus sp. OV219 TaxID=1884377 RepID=UPI0008C26367|nr:hypothetical protein [Paenibacillus sp. OV219]SEM79616.1 hypothetical protein SAMN05518847_101820 [Paenibacillus sp. OV219]
MGRLHRCSCRKVVNITYNISIHYGHRIKIIQKAESGGMINRHVGFAATQGGQIAVNRSINDQAGERNPQPGSSSAWVNTKMLRKR